MPLETFKGSASLLTNFQLNIDAPQGEETLFADIALPVPIPRLFTYRVPAEISEIISPGVRVIVQFGKKKVVTGIVEKLHHNPPDVYVAKPILDLLMVLLFKLKKQSGVFLFSERSAKEK